MASIKVWIKVKNLESEKVKISSDADIDDLKEEKFDKEKNQYYATYKNEKLPSSASVPTDTTDNTPIVFLQINDDNIQSKQPESELQKPTDLLPSTPRHRTPSDSADVVAQKDKLIATLQEEVQSNKAQMLILNTTLELQMKQIESQDKQITEWKTCVEKLIKTTEEQTKQIQTQQQHLASQDEHIKRLKAIIDDQSKQITAWFEATQKMEQLPIPVPTVAFNNVSATDQDVVKNPPPETPTIQIVLPGSSTSLAAKINPTTPSNIQIPNYNGKEPEHPTPLPTTSKGPNKSVTTVAVHQKNGQVTILPSVPNPYDISSYGTYQVTIFTESNDQVLVSTLLNIVPNPKICVPKTFVVRDAVDQIIVGATVTLTLNGEVKFKSTTDSSGTVHVTDFLPDGTYDVEINSNNSQLKKLIFKMVVFENQRPESDNSYIPSNITNPNQLNFVLKWDDHPQDLDSHMYASNGKHVFFQAKTDDNMTLDKDVTNGRGPETITVTLEPSVKYVYAVHRYTNDGELTKSKARVEINSIQQERLAFRQIPQANRPDANFWIVCVIDGTTRNIKYIDKFEEHSNFETNEVGIGYFNE